MTNLGDEVVVEKDVGGSGQQRVETAVTDARLQVGVRRLLGHALVEELRLKVNHRHRDLVLGVVAGDSRRTRDVEHGARDARLHLHTSTTS